MYFSIQWKLILTMTFLLMVSIMLNITLQVSSIYKEKEKGLRSSLIKSADFLRFSIQAQEDLTMSVAQIVASEPSLIKAFQKDDTAALSHILQSQLVPVGMFEFIITDKNGLIILDTQAPSNKGKSILQDSSFKGFEEALKGTSRKGTSGGVSGIIVKSGVPIMTNNAQIGACFNFTNIEESLTKQINESSGTVINIFNIEAMSGVSSVSDSVMSPFKDKAVVSSFSGKEKEEYLAIIAKTVNSMGNNINGYFHTIKLKGKPYLGYYSFLNSKNTSFSKSNNMPMPDEVLFNIMTPSNDLQAVIAGTLRLGIATGFLVLLLGIIFTIFIARTISRPIKELQHNVGLIKKGEFPPTLSLRSNDEIGYLANEFVEMSNALRKREGELMERTLEVSNQRQEFEELAKLAAQEQEEMATIMASVPDAVVAVDKDLNIIQWNHGAEKLTGYFKEETMGKEIKAYINLQEEIGGENVPGPPFAQIAFNQQKSVDSATRNFFLVCRDGSAIPVYVTASPVFSRESEPGAVVEIIRDISKQREIEAFKEDFLATVTHDLATPLTVILGNARILQTYKSNYLSQEDMRLLDNILNAGRNLSALVRNLLNTVKLEAGRITYNLEHFSFSRLLIETVEPFGPITTQKGISLGFNISQNIYVYGDKEKLQEVVNNLISNALKFTPKGGRITVSVEKKEDKVSLEISDTGKGIPEEAVPLLFQKFSQVKGERRGTGLGLYIVKKFVEDQNGTISVSSILGKGTSFTMLLPRGNPELVNEEPADHPITRSAHILVVEDDKDVAALIGLYLERESHVVEKAYSGKDALQIARQESHDVITIDYNLPDMNGDELALAFRNDPQLKKTPLILITGQQGLEYVPRTVMLYNRIITKPIQPDELKRSVLDVLT